MALEEWVVDRWFERGITYKPAALLKKLLLLWFIYYILMASISALVVIHWYSGKNFYIVL